jgi:MFS family permease
MCSLVFGAVWCLTLFFTATSLQTNDEKDERRPPIPGFIGPKTVRNTAEEIIALRERRRGFAEPMIQPTAPRRASMLVAKRFLPLFLVQALGAFNDNVYRFAMIGLITFQLSAQLAMSIAALGTIAGGIFILPFALFAPIAGEIADRIDKAKMMRGVKFTEMVLMVFGAFALFSNDVFFMYSVLFLMGIQSAFFSPIKYGVLPQYLGADELVRGNGFIQGGTFVAILAGTIIGSSLVVLPGGVLIASMTVLSVAAIGFIASLFAPPAPADPKMAVTLGALASEACKAVQARRLGAFVPFFSLWGFSVAGILSLTPSTGPIAGKEPLLFILVTIFWAGLALLWPSMKGSVAVARAEPRAWRAILAIAWFWFIGMSFQMLMPDYAKIQLGGDATVFTLLLASFSIGIALGATVTGLIFRGQVRVGFAPWGAVMIAIFAFDLMFATAAAAVAKGAPLQDWAQFLGSFSGWRVLFDFTGLAIGAGIYLTPLNAVYQNAAPNDARGRIVASSNMIDSALMASAAVVVTLLRAYGFATNEIYALLGASGLIAAFLTARLSPDTMIGRTALTIWPRKQ